MSKVLIVSGDGAGPELEYGLFRMREERIGVTVAAPTKKTLFTVFVQQEPGWDSSVPGIRRAPMRHSTTSIRPIMTACFFPADARPFICGISPAASI